MAYTITTVNDIQTKLETWIDELLSVLGEGRMNSVPYDTAWIGILSKKFPQHGFDDALNWLRLRQHKDGTWGAKLYYYHDRVISTLMAIIALSKAGGDQPLDSERIKWGESALWRLNGRLHLDPSETIAYPVLTVSLLREARRLGLDVPPNLYKDVEVVERKLNMLGQNSKYWKYSTMAFSLEAAQEFFPKDVGFDGSDIFEENNSIGISPAATAAVLWNAEKTNPLALKYLQETIEKQGDGGSPNVAPIDIFELAWSLHHLSLANVITPDQPLVRHALDKLYDSWDDEKGCGFSKYYSIPDLDETSVTYSVLKWGGYDVSAAPFANFEEEEHFRCYPGEIGISLSVHVRMLGAIQYATDHPLREHWEHKIAKVLRQQDINGYFWFDKWHTSPYYLTTEAVYVMSEKYQDMALPRIKWIVKTQRSDGGWGYYGFSTLEETAYCMLSLLHWHKNIAPIDRETLEMGAQYLQARIETETYDALWIGKCLYTPHNVVRSAILAALAGYYALEN